jgi:ribose-phosphate pyrophosphokinase
LDAADHLVKKCGAAKVYIIATHGVLSGDAIKKIEACDSVYKVRKSCLTSSCTNSKL